MAIFVLLDLSGVHKQRQFYCSTTKILSVRHPRNKIQCNRSVLPIKVLKRVLKIRMKPWPWCLFCARHEARLKFKIRTSFVFWVKIFYRLYLSQNTFSFNSKVFVN